jgi:tetratricopeptide (TPR) repeat protein
MALNIYERLGNLAQQAHTLNNMGVIAKERSQWSESRELYDRARVLFEAMGNRGDEAVAKYNIAEILSDQGHCADAERLLREVIRVWRAAGADADVAEARRELGRAAGRRGDFDAALALFAEARAEQVTHGQPGEVLATDARTAEVLALAGRGPEALALAEGALARVDDTDGGAMVVPGLLRTRGWAHLQAGSPEAARAEFAEAESLARTRDDAYQVAQALEGLIAVGKALGLDVAAATAEVDEIHGRLGIAATSVPGELMAPTSAARVSDPA